MEPLDFSNDQECTIESVKSVTDSTYGKKVQFRITGYPHEVSCFTKWPEKMTSGAKVFGHIEVKDGKYHNFKFGKRVAGPSVMQSDARLANLIEFKLIPAIGFMHDDIKAIRKQLMKDTYPDMDETNNANAF